MRNSNPRPIPFRESEYFTWHETRIAETQARKAFDAREQQDRATTEMLWGFGYIVWLPTIVAFVAWLGGKLS